MSACAAVKERLSRVRGIEGRIAANLLEAKRLRALVEEMAGLGGDMERARGELRRLVSQLEEDTRRLSQASRSAKNAIDRLSASEEQTLLQLRYLCGKKWDEIALDMGYSWQGIHKVHRRALEHLEEWMEVDAVCGV